MKRSIPKWILCAVACLLLGACNRNKSPNGIYSNPDGAIVMQFESNGKLTIGSRARSNIVINNNDWQGPASNQVTITTWERRGSRIYMAIPGEKESIPAFKIDGEDILFDKIRLRPMR